MSLWNLDLDRFNETDFLLEQYERRQERAKLHGLQTKETACRAYSAPSKETTTRSISRSGLEGNLTPAIHGPAKSGSLPLGS